MVKTCPTCNSEKLVFGGSEFEPEREGKYEVIFICEECNSVFAMIYETRFMEKKLIKAGIRK